MNKLSRSELLAQCKITQRINNLLYECDEINDFSKIDKIARTIDLTKMSLGRIISFLSTMKWAEKEYNSYSLLATRAMKTVVDRGEYTKGLMSGLVKDIK